MKFNTRMVALLVAAAFVVGACDTFKDETLPDSYSEVPKDISGSWELHEVTRNGTDITEYMNFSDFHLYLNEDNTYEFENYLPFIVKKAGIWGVDDPLYPFHLSFMEEGSQEAVNTEIQYVTRDGNRQLIITLSPGCHTNTYTYTFQKITES